MLSERESANHFYWFRNEADSFRSLLQHTKNMFTPICKISFPATGLFLLCLAKNSYQEWTTIAKKETFNSFQLNTEQKQFSI